MLRGSFGGGCAEWVSEHAHAQNAMPQMVAMIDIRVALAGLIESFHAGNAGNLAK